MPTPVNIPIHQFPQNGQDAISVEYITPTSLDVAEVHRHEFYELFFFRNGTGDHMVDMDHHAIDGPCFHLLAPGQVHKLDRPKETTGAAVLFSNDITFGPHQESKQALFAPGRKVATPISEEQSTEAFAIVENLDKECRSAQGRIAVSYLGILLSKCTQWAQSLSTHTDKELNDQVEGFQVLINDHFKEYSKVSDYAKLLNISPGYLNELTVKRLGKNASELLQERRLLESKRLLLHSNSSIKVIAYALGMKDPAYFTRMFKRHTGMSPNAYRESIRKKYQS